MNSIITTLESAGFEAISAQIYLILVQNGELSVPQILTHTDLSRASVYEALSELLAKDYIEYRKDGRSAYYKPAHPNKLFGLIEQKKRDFALLEGEMKETIQGLVGTYNLSLHKPGVRFFEGIEGLQEMLSDTLTNNKEKKIQTFTDLAGYSKYLGDWNAHYYAPKRKELGIVLHGFVNDDEKTLSFLKEYTASELTEVFFLDHDAFPFASEVNIYEGKISFADYRGQTPVGVIIENEAMSHTMQSMFAYAWKLAKVHNQGKQPTWKPTPSTPLAA